MSHIHIHDFGRTGNKILRRLTFQSLRPRDPGSFTLSSEPIRSLGIPGTPLAQALICHPRNALRIRRLADVDAARDNFAQWSSLEPTYFVVFTAMALDCELFQSVREWSRDYLNCLTRPGEESMNPVNEGVLCHVRCDDAWPTAGRVPHPHYPVAPVRFYREVAERTGKPLFFMGQWQLDEAYAQRLSTIRNAHFIPIQSELADLRLLLHANEIALSCSTFSWAAAFLRSDYSSVHIPRIGILDQKICPENRAILPGSQVYEYDMGAWRGDERDRNFVLS